jgi:phytol kinase
MEKIYSPSWLEPFASFSLPLGLIFVYLTVIITLAESLNRWTSLDSEVTRKIVHIGSGNVVLLGWWLKISGWIIISASAIAALVAIASYFLPILPSINSVGRKSLGTFFYALSIGILVFCFWDNFPQYTTIGILVMTWGDGMAAVIGQKFGKHKYTFAGINKSWEGSLTMLGVSYLVTSLILFYVQGTSWQTWIVALIVAIAATSLEAFSKLGIDNLTVPVGSAVICFSIGQFFKF